MRKILILLLLFISQRSNSQELSDSDIENENIVVDSTTKERYFTLYLSSGIYAFKNYDDVTSKVIFTGDASFQLNNWLYLDLKAETFNLKKETQGVIVSVIPAAGVHVFNDRRFLLMSGIGLSVLGSDAGHGGGFGTMISAVSRLRYEITKVFGVFSEARYGISPEGHVSQHFFLNLGISLQAPMHTPSY